MAVSDGMVPLLTLEDLLEIGRVLGVIGGSLGAVKGVVWLVRKLRGRKINNVEIKGDQTIIHTEGDTYNITINEYKVLRDPNVRKALKALVDPMKSEGVDDLQVGVEGQEPVSIPRNERDYFGINALPEEEIAVDESHRVIEVVSPTFRQEK